MTIAITTRLAAAALMASLASAASAADLGGNCCADLEERIAELEATTARKGNRKVSLEIYGQISEALMYWDDGAESNLQTVTNDNARSRFGFRGKAKINADWEAGYRLEVGVRTVNSKRFTQLDRKATDDSGLDMRDSHWYVKSKSLGAVYLGLGTSATNAITEANLSQTANFSKYSDVEDSGLGLLLRSSVNGGLSAISWRRLIGDGGDQPGEGERALNLARYESPSLYGFVFGASWGEDDIWDVALRYSGEGGGFKYTAGNRLRRGTRQRPDAVRLPRGHSGGRHRHALSQPRRLAQHPARGERAFRQRRRGQEIRRTAGSDRAVLRHWRG